MKLLRADKSTSERDNVNNILLFVHENMIECVACKYWAYIRTAFGDVLANVAVYIYVYISQLLLASAHENLRRRSIHATNND